MSMRMSMQVNTLKQEPPGVVFGVPSETGWCIAKPASMTHDTRLNVMLTYDMCRMPRPSMLIFEPEPPPPIVDVTGPEDMLSQEGEEEEDDLGNLLGRLAGLNSYFKDSGLGTGAGMGMAVGTGVGAEPSEEALHRAQAILSKSSHRDPELVPETPLGDQLFDVEPSSPRSYIFGESDEEESEGEVCGAFGLGALSGLDGLGDGESFGEGEGEEPGGVMSDTEDSFAFDRKSRFFGRQRPNRPTLVAV